MLNTNTWLHATHCQYYFINTVEQMHCGNYKQIGWSQANPDLTEMGC